MTSSTTIFTPYTFIQCPCTDSQLHTRRLGGETPTSDDETDDERPFDPRAPRANYSLYPLEHLLYCEDCHQIRCPRCVLDEIVCWFCPNCLFEVASSTVKSEGNRCTRSCFQCPICIVPLSVSSLEVPPKGLGADQASQNGPFVLFCPSCAWSSSEIGITFDKGQGIHGQLAKIRNAGDTMPKVMERRLSMASTAVEQSVKDEGEHELQPPLSMSQNGKSGPESHFASLKSFYHSQLAEASPVSSLGFSVDYGYGSPGALSRIMGLYTGNNPVDKKSKSKPPIMREAHSALEGLQLTSPDDQAVTTLRTQGWQSTSSALQRNDLPNQRAHFLSDLRPIPYQLRTKRSKRCRTCRHILSKPEAKVAATRFRIRLVALNYMPSITISPLQPTSSSSSLLTPMKPTQFVLKFTNPLFDTIKVTLATPAQTPGRFTSRVTVLCPEFEVGANTDVWDEALSQGANRGSTGDKRRTKAEASEGQQQAEAGKVWEQGRNWVSVVVEVVPASVSTSGPEFLKTSQQREDNGPMREDEDVLEIPVFVRVKWESDPAHDEGTGLASLSKERDGREERELAYWCVLGLGRIALV